MNFETTEKIPILGDIPILKPIFQKKKLETSKSDIVFLITPYILK